MFASIVSKLCLYLILFQLVWGRCGTSNATIRWGQCSTGPLMGRFSYKQGPVVFKGERAKTGPVRARFILSVCPVLAH